MSHFARKRANPMKPARAPAMPTPALLRRWKVPPAGLLGLEGNVVDRLAFPELFKRPLDLVGGEPHQGSGLIEPDRLFCPGAFVSDQYVHRARSIASGKVKHGENQRTIIRLISVCYEKTGLSGPEAMPLAVARRCTPHPACIPAGAAAAPRGTQAWRGVPMPIAVLGGVGPLQRLARYAAVSDGLGIVAERHGRIGMAGDLRHEADLDALRL